MLETNPEAEQPPTEGPSEESFDEAQDKQPAEVPPTPEQPTPPNLDISREKVSQDIKEERVSEDLGEKPTHPAQVFSILVLLIVILGSGLLFGLIFWRQSQVEALSAAISKNREKLETSELKQTEEILINLKRQISTLRNFKQSQVLYSKLLQQIQSTVHQRIKLTSVSLSPEGQIDFSGEAENYQTLAKFLVSLQQNRIFDQITLNSSTLAQQEEQTRITFTLTAKIKPDLLKKTETGTKTEGEESGQ